MNSVKLQDFYTIEIFYTIAMKDLKEKLNK